MSTWRYAHASVKGTSHEKSGKACQDSSACIVVQDLRGNSVLVTVASDGAGSAQHSEIGSALTCSLFVDEMKAFFDTGNDIKMLSRDFYLEWIQRLQQEIAFRATENKIKDPQILEQLRGVHYA
jgi:serine/threonine protein phosphatase PrpC